jgi:metal-dependent amidase/aminoacylase/carboxypeptidase family protein
MTEEEYCAIPLDKLVVASYAILSPTQWNYVASYFRLCGDMRFSEKHMNEEITKKHLTEWQEATQTYLGIDVVFHPNSAYPDGWPINASQWNEVVTAVYQRRHAEVVT